MKNTVRKSGNRPEHSIDRHRLYRIAVARCIDALFFEAGNARWNHHRCHALVVHNLLGIGQNTFRTYRHYPSDRLAGIELPQHLHEMLRLHVLLMKRLPPSQTAEYLHELHSLIEAALDDLRDRGVHPDAERLIDALRRPKTTGTPRT